MSTSTATVSSGTRADRTASPTARGPGLIADVAVLRPCQGAIGRVEPQQPEGLARDQGVHQVAVDAAIDQLPCVAGTLGVVLDGEMPDLLTPEGVGGLAIATPSPAQGSRMHSGPSAGASAASALSSVGHRWGSTRSFELRASRGT